MLCARKEANFRIKQSQINLKYYFFLFFQKHSLTIKPPNDHFAIFQLFTLVVDIYIFFLINVNKFPRSLQIKNRE